MEPCEFGEPHQVFGMFIFTAGSAAGNYQEVEPLLPGMRTESGHADGPRYHAGNTDATHGVYKLYGYKNFSLQLSVRLATVDLRRSELCGRYQKALQALHHAQTVLHSHALKKRSGQIRDSSLRVYESSGRRKAQDVKNLEAIIMEIERQAQEAETNGMPLESLVG